MAKRKTKKSKIVLIFFVAFFIYILVSFLWINVDISKRRSELKQAKSELTQQQYLNQEITNILHSGENTEYIMRVAQEKLGLAFPNERVIIDYKKK